MKIKKLNIKNYLEAIFKSFSSRLVDYSNPKINIVSEKKIK